MSVSVQSSLIGVFVTVAVALGVLLGRRRRADVLFVIFAINIALWFAAGVARGTMASDLWARTELALATLTPASLLRLFVELLRGGTPGGRRIMTASYPLSGLLFLLSLSPVGDLYPFQVLAGVYVFATILLTASVLRDRSTADSVEGARLTYLTIGAALVTGVALLGHVPELGEGASAAGHIAVMFYLFFLSQAISRDRLLDLHEFVSRMIVLGALGLVFAAISSVLILGLGASTGGRLLSTAVIVVILLTLHDPLKDRLEAKTIELFFRERHELRMLLEELRYRLLRVLDPATMSRLVLDTLYDARRATHAAVYLLDPVGGRAFLLHAHRGPEPWPRVDERELPELWHAIQRQRSPLLTEQLAREQSGAAAHRVLIEAMRKVSADVLLPLVSGETVLGFVALRDDRVTEPYSTEEIALLMSISDAAVIVLENSQLAAQLRERDRLAALGEMAAGLAHEIRNPLGAIKGAAQCLDPRELTREEDGEFLKVIVEETDRLNGVVSQFLDYARPFRINYAEVDPNEVIRRVAKTLEVKQQDAPDPIPIELDLDESMGRIEADGEQLKQVLLNLGLNALDASATSRRPIRIVSRYLKERDRIEIRVKDRGHGIPREAIDHVFIPFYTTKPQGTGLGLAVCQRIITNHGGHIHVQSAVGEGTEFVLRIPARRKRDGGTTGSFGLARRGAEGPPSEPSTPGREPE